MAPAPTWAAAPAAQERRSHFLVNSIRVGAVLGWKDKATKSSCSSSSALTPPKE